MGPWCPNRCNLIIGVGFNLEKAIHTSAERTQDLFTTPSSTPASTTVKQQHGDVRTGASLLFNTAEAAYLAGYVAAGMTRPGKVATRRHPDPLGHGVHGWLR